ncbi:MAG: DUF1648 domain-containing protein [Cyclobacteriaceae bacterium]|nr:DUF1648 domain-containing protein [Cyclobacteriaceae bacterium]
MSRPRINIRMTPVDWALEIICIAGIGLTVFWIASSYPKLPDTIPIHFGSSGVANGFGSKSMLWILPIVMGVTYIIQTIAVRFPHLFNYPIAITEENAARQYKNQVLMIRVLKPILVLIFLYISYATIQNGLGVMHSLSPWLLPVTLVFVFGTIAFFIFRGFRLR